MKLAGVLRRGVAPVLTGIAVVLSIAGCHSGGGTSAAASSAAAQRSQAKQVLQSATANPEVQAAVAKAKKDVVNPCIDASNGPVTFKNCVYAKVPEAKRSQVRKCVGKALLSDHISTEAGKAKWLDTDVPACVGAVLP